MLASPPGRQLDAGDHSGLLFRWRKPAIAILLIAYFFLMSADGLKAHFTADDMMDIYTYWHPSPWRLLTSHFLIWRGYFRPMGGAFYMPPFLQYGLNPVPFHLALLLLLLAGAYQMYRFARVLGLDEFPAAMVALIACYHGGLSNLYYVTAFSFDALCAIFYLGAFHYYARIRATGKLLSGGQTAVFLGLFLCALNSKEMAITLPAVLLAYEWLYHGLPAWPWRKLLGWISGPGRVLCWAALLTAVFLYGKAYGQYGLLKNPAYRPEFSWARLVDFQERYLGDIFYHLPRFEGIATIVIWLVVTYVAWRRNRPLLRFCWFYVVLAPLPIEFLADRDQACLYVTLPGWAVLASALFMDWLPGAGRFLAGEWLFQGIDAHRLRTLLCAAAMCLVALGSWNFKRTEISTTPAILDDLVFDVIHQFNTVKPQVGHGAKVVFLDDPLHTFDTAFISELWFRDRGVQVRLNRMTPLSPQEIAKADHVFTFENGKLLQLR